MGIFDVRQRDLPGGPGRAAAGFGDAELYTFGHLDTRTMLGPGHRIRIGAPTVSMMPGTRK